MSVVMIFYFKGSKLIIYFKLSTRIFLQLILFLMCGYTVRRMVLCMED
jgi:hypothetical protein